MNNSTMLDIPMINSFQGKNGVTLLHKAVMESNINRIDALLKHGANINVVDADGNTVLHYAFSQRSTKMIKLLIERDADMTISNNVGTTFLSLVHASPLLESGVQKIVQNFNKLNTSFELARTNGTLSDWARYKPLSAKWSVYTKFCKSIGKKLPSFDEVAKFLSTDLSNDEFFDLGDAAKMLSLPREIFTAELKVHYPDYSTLYHDIHIRLLQNINYVDQLQSPKAAEVIRNLLFIPGISNQLTPKIIEYLDYSDIAAMLDSIDGAAMNNNVTEQNDAMNNNVTDQSDAMNNNVIEQNDAMNNNTTEQNEVPILGQDI